MKITLIYSKELKNYFLIIDKRGTAGFSLLIHKQQARMIITHLELKSQKVKGKGDFIYFE